MGANAGMASLQDLRISHKQHTLMHACTGGRTHAPEHLACSACKCHQRQHWGGQMPAWRVAASDAQQHWRRKKRARRMDELQKAGHLVPMPTL